MIWLLVKPLFYVEISAFTTDEFWGDWLTSSSQVNNLLKHHGQGSDAPVGASDVGDVIWASI
jgi:hypothetical protein